MSTGSGQTLKFTVDLKNETNKPLPTSLVAQAPQGWTVRFKPQFGDQQISSIQLKENGSETLSVEVDTPATADAKSIRSGSRLSAGAFEASTNVKVSLKGTQDLKMAPWPARSPPLPGHQDTDRLRGRQRYTAPVRNLNFVTKKPSDKWTVEFKPDKIDALGPGEVRQIKMEPSRRTARSPVITC